jgi:hypothetical protein
MYPAKDVDKEFIQSDTYILSILWELSDKDTDRKIYSLWYLDFVNVTPCIWQ